MNKIAIITSGTLPVPATKGGGVESLVEILLNENENKQEFEFTVFTIFDKNSINIQKEYRFSKFVNIDEKPLSRKITILFNRYLYAVNRRILKKPWLMLQAPFCRFILKKGKLGDFDAVLVESNFNIVPLLKRAGAKKVLYHSHYNDVHPGISKFEMQRYNYGYNFVDANLSVSNFIQRNIQKVIKKKLDYFVIENCTPLFDMIDNIEKERIFTQYGIPKGKTIFMYSGRITPEKGVTQLLNAYKLLNNLDDICLVVVGGIFYSDNRENEFLKNLKIMATQCTNPVIFTGYVAHQEMLKLWQVANIAVLPTYDVEEAAGLVVIEAMAAGIPVIHSDSGGMGEYSSPECAIMIPRGKGFVDCLGKKMEYLCQSPEVLNEMSRKARIRAQEWSSENYYAKLCKSIKKVIAKEEIEK